MKALFRQFGHPTGPLGWLVGHAMALKNGARSRLALDVLAPKPGERVVEIGFGPGVDVSRIASSVGSDGFVAGVDVSREMVRQATRRNDEGVRAGRVDLRVGSSERLPFESERFDAAYATNSAQFWPDLRGGLAEVLRVLRPGGRALVVVQPMWRGATESDTHAWRDKLRDGMNEVGFRSVETEEVQLAPLLAVLATGIR
ncbi:MAG TPA: methyltransferase domain-containing protein [Polyangiaceae bacterium]